MVRRGDDVHSGRVRTIPVTVSGPRQAGLQKTKFEFHPEALDAALSEDPWRYDNMPR